MLLQSNEQIRELLTAATSIAVVGVSDKPDRPSHAVARYLVDHTPYTVWLVNPTLDRIGDHPVYPNLAALPGVPDIVDVFRRVADIPPVLDDALAVGAHCIWLQLGLVDQGIADRAIAAGMDVVMDHCLKVEHERLMH